MVNYLSFSQSLIPSVIKINSKKYYCYDSSQIRQVAIYINNSFTCDSIIEDYKQADNISDSIIVGKDRQYKNLDQQRILTQKQFDDQKQETDLYKREVSVEKKKNKLLTIIIIGEAVLILLNSIHK